jgi:hypothetical protein
MRELAAYAWFLATNLTLSVRSPLNDKADVIFSSRVLRLVTRNGQWDWAAAWSGPRIRYPAKRRRFSTVFAGSPGRTENG